MAPPSGSGPPKLGSANTMFVRLAGTGSGAVTLRKFDTNVPVVALAPTLTFPSSGWSPVAGAGPALPLDIDTNPPARHALAKACSSGSPSPPLLSGPPPQELFIT